MATLSINKIYEEVLERGNAALTLSSEQNASLKQMLDPASGFGRALHAALEDVGERFGLYNIMVQSGPITPACLATQAGIPEQSARIWLDAQASGNYLHHNVSTDQYCLWRSWPPGRWNGPR